MTLRLGTRGSALALAQAGMVRDALVAANPGLSAELVQIKTSGDEGQPGAAGDDKARFVKEIEQALLDDRIDLGVHSAKDVPGELPDGLAIVAVPARADARDSICGAASLEALPAGGRVGTTSLRRRAQLLALRPDLEVVDLRGNVDTRLARLASDDLDALLLAAAGLERLGRSAEGTPVPLAAMTPAPGQGCLALEARTGDSDTAGAAAALIDQDALAALTAERALVSALSATCNTPVGALAQLEGGDLVITAFVGLPDGSTWIRDEISGRAAAAGELGRQAAARLLAAGAGDILAEAERLAEGP
ncbi:MAG: hydroxymethylbilane synthase [Thermoleophilaceae bacterium]|nr:hydroxymethylbilane synthase [Thermoleophilaceae bacterium]